MTLNVPLLDYLLSEGFLQKCFYPEDSETKLKIADFASEFFIFYRGLAHELRVEVSDRLRKMDIGRAAINEFHSLLAEKKVAALGPLPEKLYM